MSIASFSEQLRSKEISVEQLFANSLSNAKKASELNVFTNLVDANEQQISKAQVAIDGGDVNPLCGIPIAYKDIFCTLDLPTTCGSKILTTYKSPYESHATKQLFDAGAITVGKCNMDEFAMGSTGENSSFGPSLNPWNKKHAPGGSSSGSAVAVAAGVVPVALGTDTGGSVRMPAAYCGISGMKPTYGHVSRRGMVAYSSSMDQAGVFALNADDLRTTLATIAGNDPWDSTSNRDHEKIITSITTKHDLSNLRIGIADEFFSEHVDAGISDLVKQAIDELGKLGAEVVNIKFPHLEYAVSAYYIIACAEASSNLARFDGLLYGTRDEASTLDDCVMQSRSHGFGAEVQKRIMLGTFCLSHGYVDAYYHQAQKIRQLLASDFDKAFATCDVIATPTTPTTAPLLGAFTAHPELMYQQDICTVTANMCQLPAISIPCGLIDDMPVGMQLLGPRNHDGVLLSVAERFQQATDHHQMRSDFFIQ